QLEELENRLAPAVITVTTTADDLLPNEGSVSIREAISAINAGFTTDADILNQSPGSFGANDTIRFNLSASGPFTIRPSSALPNITAAMTIDGSTQSGFSGTPLIELDGS